MAKEKTWDEAWRHPVIKVGRFTLLGACILTLVPVVYLYVVHGVTVEWAVMFSAWFMIVMMFGAFYIVEPISYYPILGLAGTYMSFLAGNISSLRLPCSAIAQEVTETVPGTNEAELTSALGIAGSMVTNLIMISLCAGFGAIVIAVLPVTIMDALKLFIIPAIFGAVFGQFSIKVPKIVPFAFALPIIMRLLGLHVAIVIPVSLPGNTFTLSAIVNTSES